VLTIISLLISLNGTTQAPGGGDLNPGISSNRESIEKFMDLRLGLSVHWGPSSLGGKEISWSRENEIPKNIYDNFYKTFCPSEFDAREWVELAKDGGMKYISITSKHHDGFSLWSSAYTEYDIANTPFKRDIVKELSEACKNGGLVFGSYYSIIDWYHPDYQPYDHGGPGELYPQYDDTPNFERYIIFMKNQLKELVIDYGAEIIQFDGEWDPTWDHQLGSDLYLYVRKLNDNVLVNSRTDVGRFHLNPETRMWDWKIYAGDFEERERMVDWVESESDILGKSDNPWQAWVTIDQAQWAWNETPRLLTSDEIIIDFLKTIGDNGNYLINLGPRPDGTFHPDQMAIVKEFGRWVRKYAEAIYGTRGGPFTQEDRYTSTIKAKTVYVFVYDHALEKIEIETGKLQIERVLNFEDNEVSFSMTNNSLVIEIPKREKENIHVLKLLIK